MVKMTQCNLIVYEKLANFVFSCILVNVKCMIDQKIKERIIDVLKVVKPEKIVLFGSYVYGVPSSDSDIDLLIIKNIKTTEVRNYRLNVKKLLWQEFKDDSIWFDILVDSEKRIADRIKLGDLFYEEIYSKGQVLCEG